MKEKHTNPVFGYENKNSATGFDIPDISMFGMLKICAQAHPDAPAFDYFGKKCSYSALVEKIEKISACYGARGVKKGDIVTVIMPNTPEAVISIYALNRIGATANVIHPLSAQEEIKNYINSSDSKTVLILDSCKEKLKEVINATGIQTAIVASPAESLPPLMKILFKIKNRGKNTEAETDRRFISWSDFVKCPIRTNEYIPTADDADTPAIILHSGGTTGTPKDIMLSNRNFNAFGIQAVLTLRDVSVGDKILAILPIFHGFGLGVCVHVCFCFGACSVLIPQFDSKKFASVLKKHKPTMLFGVPTLYEALLKAKGTENMDFSFLKYAVSGGDSLPEKLEISVNEFLKNHNSSVKICEGYGMTEGLAALSLSVGDAYKSGTIGKPLIGNEMCIVEPDTTNTLPCNTDGELCVTGPTVMLGYRNNSDETANTLRVHNDGKIWLHTGDMAYIDAEGFVHYKLRLKRMMISSGFNVFPTQIEKVIEELDFVEKCVAVAVSHPYKKEVAKAYIILKDGTPKVQQTETEIRLHCEKSLAHHSVPYYYEFVDSLPKTPYNKIDFLKLQKDSAKEAVS
ncbi:MAG: AMP-binding protein [Clostridia bacterium]|nr:AMP-binding protein [Clostridia bacterium]